VEGFTDDHCVAFKQYGTERVLIAYDRDDAGESATQKLAAKLIARSIDCYRVLFPKGMDANDYALKVTPAAKSLALLIEGAQLLGKARRETGGAPMSDTVTIEAPPATKACPEPRRREERRIVTPAIATANESPLPFAAPPLRVDVETALKLDGLLLSLGDRRYRVRGLEKNTSYERLAVNLKVTRAEAFHLDTVDLCSARQRKDFIKQAATELGVEAEVIKKDLGKVLRTLEELQDEHIRQALEPKERIVALTEAEQTAAFALLRDPHLLNRILADFVRCGMVGEETNKLVGYLAAVSRLLATPLGVMIQSSSAAGKTALMDAVLGFIPEEQRVKYSAVTGQALFRPTAPRRSATIPPAISPRSPSPTAPRSASATTGGIS
jgi:DNA primase